MATALPLVNVTVRLVDQDGDPVIGAKVSAKLMTVERYKGYVIPEEYLGVTDDQGTCIVRLFPNELGTEGSEYRFKISYPKTSNGKSLPSCHIGGSSCYSQGGKSLTVYASIPNADCNLEDVCDLDPYPIRGSGQILTEQVLSAAEAAKKAAQDVENIKPDIEAAKQAAITATTKASIAESSATIAGLKADESASKAAESSSWASRAKAWAESTSIPNPDEPDSKSAKSWAEEAKSWSDEAKTHNDQMPVTATGTTTPRSIADRFADLVNVKDFGAKGDGVTDDTAAIQAAIDHAEDIGGGTVYIPANMQLKCSARIFGKPGVSIKCEPSSWLDFRGSSWLTPTGDMALFGYYGTVGSPIFLETDAVEGTNKIHVPDPSQFAVGDMVELSMESSGKWNDTSVDVTAGQVAIVTGVYSGTGNIVLSEPIYETLTVANSAKIRIINPIRNVIIDGLGIIGNGRNPDGNAEQGIKIFFGRDVIIKNCRIKHVDTQSIGVVSCYSANIFNNFIEDAPLGDVDVISYGIAYSSSMYIRIYGNQVINSRHGVISSHLYRGYGYYGVNRFIEIYANSITSNYGDLNSSGFIRAHAGIAGHTDVEFMSVHDNFITGCRSGVNIRTGNNRVYGNTITSCRLGIYLSEYFSDIVISDNSIFDVDSPVFTPSEVYDFPRGLLNITKNTIRNSGGSSLNIGNYNGNSLLLFSGNTVDQFVAYSDVSAVLSVYGKCGVGFIDNKINGGKSLVIRIDTTDSASIIKGNILFSDTDASSQVFIKNIGHFCVIDNTFLTKSTTLSPISAPSKIDVQSSVISGNVVMEY